MASSGITVGFLVALVACVIILVVPNPENERATRLQNRIKDILSGLVGAFSKETVGPQDLGADTRGGDATATPDVAKLFTKEELKAYDGSLGSPGLHLAILGKVFDVAKGAKHYAPGSGYDFFAAHDGSKAFITGDFTKKGLVPDVSELNPQEMVGLRDWVKFFEKEYRYVGKLIGHFYDEEGNPTSNLVAAFESIQEGEKMKEDEAAIQRRYPPCNSEWKQATGVRVWCSKKSGGIQRDWIGIPRKLFNPGTNKWRCACVNEPDVHSPLLSQYADCDPEATSCKGDS